MTNHSTPSNTKQVQHLKKQVAEQNMQIKELSARLATLEGKLIQMESTSKISERVNEVLAEKLDDLNQYSRRSCLVIDGIKPDHLSSPIRDAKHVICENLGIPEDVFYGEIDKAHPIGPIKEDNTQSVIVKFKSDSFREHIHNNRKNMKNKKYKIRVSLTQRRLNLITEAKALTENLENVDYIFNDVNGNVKLKLKMGKKKYYTFNSIVDLAEILGYLEYNDAPPTTRDDTYRTPTNTEKQPPAMPSSTLDTTF